MAHIEQIAVMARKDKIWGKGSDRFIADRRTMTTNYAQLALVDYRRNFDFNDFKMGESFIINQLTSGSDYAYAGYGGQYLNVQNEIATNHELKAQDRHTPPLFFSSAMSGFRDYYNYGNNISCMLGYFKGPGPIFTVDGTGNAGDYLPPTTKLMVSTGSVVHKYVENGKIEPLLHNSAAGNDPWTSTYNLNGMPVVLGYHPKYAHYGYFLKFMNNFKSPVACTGGIATRWNHIIFSRFIGQDATHIYYLQFNDTDLAVTNWQYNSSPGSPPDMIELVSLQKSNSALTDLAITTSHYIPTQIGGYIIAEVTTTEGTPRKAIYMLFIPGSGKSNVTANKIISNALTNIGTFSFGSGMSGNYKCQPTKLMENKASGYTDYWKAYLPTLTNTDNNCTPQLMRQGKTLLSSPSVVNCTITGLPAEYASTDGTKIKPLPQVAQAIDACWAAEIYDGTDQYIALWLGRTKNPWWTSGVSSYSYSEVSDTKYRWFLVFKVDPTDDSKLIYQSCIPEFKLMKPIHSAVASPDNKHIVVANEDGVHCFIWSTTSKGFIAVDSVNLPGAVALGMDEVNSTDKNNVFVEVLDATNKIDDCLSYLYQISFGDYQDVDMRYYTGSAYVYDFGQITFPTNFSGGVFQPMTATIDVRVKNKVDGVETAFVANKSVRLRISGVRESDGVTFTVPDSGIPQQKTVTTGSDWVSVSISYSKPFSSLRISSEIIA